MKQIPVDLGVRSYDIFIGQGLLQRPGFLTPYLAKNKVLIVTNDTIAPQYLPQTLAAVSQSHQVESVILPDGEGFKTLEQLDSIFTRLLDKNFGRSTTLVALGGGVIGDMTGFSAACYQRGVDFIQIPTTLLSQVDSSVGGKTGVNHPLGKNMIGAFYQPKVVVIDTECLSTLPEREFASGMAEVIKYGIIWDQAFFCWLEEHVQELIDLDQSAIEYAIARCCEIKSDIVAQDETELGVRAILNLGHTFGHAIEAQMGYGNWLHGEAVAAGMVLAANTSVKLGLMQAVAQERIIALLNRFSLPVTAPDNMGFDDFITHMRRDKKNIHGKIRLVLPLGLGEAKIVDNVDDCVLEQIINSKSVN